MKENSMRSAEVHIDKNCLSIFIEGKSPMYCSGLLILEKTQECIKSTFICTVWCTF